jgi:hypothetical protein
LVKKVNINVQLIPIITPTFQSAKLDLAVL